MKDKTPYKEYGSGETMKEMFVHEPKTNGPAFNPKDQDPQAQSIDKNAKPVRPRPQPQPPINRSDS